ncbi:unnamed protein product [Ectocarpus sp. CCAP 1310/34]|nr:unnamed protein product [Ectocarpus sp. CCAP 1310/34]
MLRLGKLDNERGFYRKRTPSAGRAARAVRHKPLNTVREVVAGIEDPLEHDYFAVGLLALVAAVKRCNIVVWEAKTGGGLRIVEIGDTTCSFVGDLYRDEFLHLVYNDFGGYNAATDAAGTATVRSPSSSNVAESKFNHFSAIVIPQESVPWSKPYMLQRASSGRSVFGHEKPPDNFCQCPTTSGKCPMKHQGSPVPIDVDDETETSSSVRSRRSAGGARPVKTASPRDVPERKATPPGKAMTKPAVRPSASGMSATTRSKEKPMPKEKPRALQQQSGRCCGVGDARGRWCRRSSLKKEAWKAGAPQHLLCNIRKRPVSKGSPMGPKRNLPAEPEGDDDMSDGGSEGDFWGDAADYDQDVFVSGKSPQQVKAMVDKIQEAWGKEVLTFIFGLVQNTKQLVQDRNKKKKARSEVEEDAPEGGDTGEEQNGDGALDTADEHSWTTRGINPDVDWSARYDGGLSGGHDARSGARGGNCDSTGSGAAGNGGERAGTVDDDRSRAGAGGGAAGSFEGDGEGSGRDGNGNGGNVGSGNDGKGDGGDGFDFGGEGSYRGDGHQYYNRHRRREGEGEDANEYFNFCRSTKIPKGQEQRHRDKKARKGKSSWPKKAITKSMMQGVIGIRSDLSAATGGHFQATNAAVHDHLSCHSFHDYKLVRACLPRDTFLLIYGRFFHMASSGAPERLQDGTTEPCWDSLHDIRYELCGWFVHGD